MLRFYSPTFQQIIYNALHVISRTRLPLFSRAYVEKIGEPGDEATNTPRYRDLCVDNGNNNNKRQNWIFCAQGNKVTILTSSILVDINNCLGDMVTCIYNCDL